MLPRTTTKRSSSSQLPSLSTRRTTSSFQIGAPRKLARSSGPRRWRMQNRWVSSDSASTCSLAYAILQCIKLSPSWSKGYARKGAALHGARRYDEAIETYEAGLRLEDSPALRKGLQEVKDAKGRSFPFIMTRIVVDAAPKTRRILYLSALASFLQTQISLVS